MLAWFWLVAGLCGAANRCVPDLACPGLSYGHALQAAGKRDLPAEELIHFQTRILGRYAIGAGIPEMAALAGASVATATRRNPVIARRSGGALALIGAAFAIWTAGIQPINGRLSTWNGARPQQDVPSTGSPCATAGTACMPLVLFSSCSHCGHCRCTAAERTGQRAALLGPASSAASPRWGTKLRAAPRVRHPPSRGNSAVSLPMGRRELRSEGDSCASCRTATSSNRRRWDDRFLGAR